MIGGTGLYWNVGTSSICHAYSTVSITSKEFTKFQIVLRTWNPSVKLEIHCAFIRSAINCICNIDFLWSKFPVAILYSLSSKVKLFKGWGVWQTHSMYNAYFIQHSFYLHHPPPFVLSHCPSYYYSLAFQGRCAQVLQIYGNRKLTDPHFQEKIWPISVHPSEYIQPQNAQTNLHACRQSILREAMLLFWDEDIAFLGHTKWSTKHSGNNQMGTVKDTRSQVLAAVNISAPISPFSLSLHTGADTQALFTQCLPVECIVLSFFFIYSDTHWSLSIK